MPYAFAGQYGPEPILHPATGRPRPNTAVAVYLAGTTTPAVLWADRARAVAVANPVPTSAVGNLTFFADPRTAGYDLVIGSSPAVKVTVVADADEPDDDVVAEAAARVAADNAHAASATAHSGTYVDLTTAQTLTNAPKKFVATTTGDPLIKFESSGGVARNPLEVRDLSQIDPFRLRTYIVGYGALLTMSNIVISAKKLNINGDIQGVGASADGSEPNMLAISPDLNGPCIAIEAHGLPAVAGLENSAAIAIYDFSQPIGGATPWSAGFHAKTFVVDGKGKMWWGQSLGLNAAVNADMSLARDSGTAVVTGRGLRVVNNGDSPTLVLRKVAAQTTQLVEFQTSTGAVLATIDRNAAWGVASGGVFSLVTVGLDAPFLQASTSIFETYNQSVSLKSFAFGGSGADLLFSPSADYPYMAWRTTGTARVTLTARLGDASYALQLDAAGGLILNNGPLFVAPSAVGAVPLTVQAPASATSDIARFTEAGTIATRINKAGYFMTRKVAAPADADLVASELAIWLDNTAGATKAMFKAKDSAGTVRTATVAMA